MERRKFLIGAGGTAIGASALVGSGAFTSVQADRSLEVDVADDADAFLALRPSDGPNGEQYASTDNGLLELDFSTTDEGGSGVNKEADTIIRDVFEIENQGTQTVVIGITGIPDGMSFYADEDDGAVPPSEGTSLNQDSYGAGSEHLPQIGAGGSLDRVGVAFYGKNNDLSDLADHDNPITINAYTEDEAGELS